MNHEILTVPLENLRINGGTQSRAELNEAAVADYAEAIRFAVALPPVTVFFDGSEFWLADGFHRYHAHRAAGAMEIEAEVREGTRRDAILYSVGANAAHGLRRTNEDKRRSVMTLLNDAEWSSWTQSKIAETCGVSREFVSRLSANLDPSCDRSQDATRTVTRNGKTYEQNVTNIGRAKEPTDSEPTPPAVKSQRDAVDSEISNTPEAESGMAAAPVAPTTPPAVVELPASELDALRTENDELRASLKETLADNEMMGRVFDADDKLKAAMDEAKKQKAIAVSAERTLAAKNGEFMARAEQVSYWKRRAEKAEAALAAAGKVAA